MELFQKVRPLRHYLRQERKDVRGALPHQSPELRATEEHGSRFFRRACIRDVMTIGRESLAPESLSYRGNNGNESAPDFDFVAQDYMSIKNDEDAICRRTTLIELEPCGPGRSRPIRADRRNFIRSET